MPLRGRAGASGLRYHSGHDVPAMPEGDRAGGEVLRRVRRAARSGMCSLRYVAPARRKVLSGVRPSGSRPAAPPRRGSPRPTLHPQAPRREDPHLEERPRRRAQAGHRALRRRLRVHVALRAARPRGRPRPHEPRLRADAGRGPPLRGHRQPVPRRRDHGAVRGPDRPRGPRPARGPRRAGHPARLWTSYRDELQRRRGIVFQVRQGLNTGLVVVGSIGTDLRMDYTAVGDTTNVAARLQQAADPGRIVISGATHRLVDGLLLHPAPRRAAAQGQGRAGAGVGADRGPRGPDAPRGRGRARAHALRGPRAGARAPPGCLRASASRAGPDRLRRRASPGIGKSRLLLEFRRRLGDDATWVEGHCMSFGRSIAFHPLIDLLKRSFRIEEGDDESAIVRKIERGVLVLGEDLRPILPLPPVPALGRPRRSRRARPWIRSSAAGEIFDAVRRLLMRAAEVHPQVCVFEDLHWMDGRPRSIWLSVADSVAGEPRCSSSSPTGPATRIRSASGPITRRLALDALSGEDSVQMAQAVLARRVAAGRPAGADRPARPRAIPSSSRRSSSRSRRSGAIRPDGDRYVLARPLDEIVVPDTIQDVIMARIDRLEEASKKTLQLASVIGREFTRRLLDRIADIRGRDRGVPARAQGHRADLREARSSPSWPTCSSTPSPTTWPTTRCSSSGGRSCTGSSGSPSRSSTPTGSPSTTRCSAYHFTRGEEWAKALHYLLEAAAKAAARSAPSRSGGASRAGPRRARAPAGEPGAHGARDRPSARPAELARPARRLRSHLRGALAKRRRWRKASATSAAWAGSSRI